MRIHALFASLTTVFLASPVFAQEQVVPQGDVFDGDYVVVGAGLGMAPSYEGSNDSKIIPLLGATGEVSGIGFSIRGPSLSLDLVPDRPIVPGSNVSLRLGPQIKYRAGRSSSSVKDDVVALLPKLDGVIEAGGRVGIGIDDVISTADRLNLGVSARFDISGKGAGYVVTPSASYRLPVSRRLAFGALVSAQFVDGDYADYYFAIDPAGAIASGLPQYDAKGGFKDLTIGLAAAYDVSGDFLDGGLAVGLAMGYSRLFGSAAETPITSDRGSRDQFLFGAGIAHSF